MVKMFRFSFLEIVKVKPKESSAWAILAYFPFGIWGALALIFFGNPYQKKHGKFAFLLDLIILIWIIPMYLFSQFWMNEVGVSNREYWMFSSAFFVLGLTVLFLYQIYSIYLALTGRYVKVNKLID